MFLYLCYFYTDAYSMQHQGDDFHLMSWLYSGGGRRWGAFPAEVRGLEAGEGNVGWVHGWSGGRVLYCNWWQEGGTDPGSSLQQWESREGCREDVAAQIPAECLTCMVVPVFPVSCLDLTPITDFLLLHSNSCWCISCHSSTPFLYSAAWDSLP